MLRTMPLPLPLPLALAMLVMCTALAQSKDMPELRCPINTETQCLQYSNTSFGVEGINFTYKVDNFIRLECDDSLQLDTLWSLPRFKPALHVVNVFITNCLPTNYAAVLAALNIRPTTPFNLELSNTGTSEPLTTAHFANLPRLHHLMQSYGVLHGFPASLESLTLEYMWLDETLLEALPRNLTKLRLVLVNITHVPAEVLELPALRSLHVEFQYTRDRYEWMTKINTVEPGNASRLQQLFLNYADAGLLSEWVPPVLQEATLWRWQARNPKALPACDKLVKLTLRYVGVCELPPGWVARCPLLQVLEIRIAFILRVLPAKLLENATQLTSFVIYGTKLTSLPPQLFADTPNLTHLDISENLLIKLPSSVLRSKTGALPLLSLNLAFNDLDISVVRDLAVFTELRNLSVMQNQRIGDLCMVNHSNVPGKSPLAPLSKLERLTLWGTSITTICSDWREDMVNLTYLSLRDTNIANLTYKDLQYRRRVPAVVELAGRLHFTAKDYDKAVAAAAGTALTHNVIVTLTTNTPYTCNLYWITKALNDDFLSLRDVELGRNLSLRAVRAEDLLCLKNVTCVTVPRGCDCGMTDDGLLRVICVGIKLDRVLSLESIPADVDAVDLVLVNNSITELVLEDLPRGLRILDLRNNSISYIAEPTARALVSGASRRMRLEGNRIPCSCRTAPALRVLYNHDALQCEDGRTLKEAIDVCWTLTTMIITPTLPTVTATVLALYLWWKRRRVHGRTRVLLWRLGWRSRDERDARWPLDAFVMFGRGDEALALELTARLERGPRARRVCLAERDWLTPARLSDCIARSACAARRTVALVSREWERSLETDEIQAAYAPAVERGALVLVLPSACEVEHAMLRQYATDYPHMVLHRDSPEFWRRLERVVPPSPAPASPPVSTSIPLVPLNLDR